MIPIKFDLKNTADKEKALDNYYELITQNRNLGKLNELDTWCKNNLTFCENGKKKIYSFEDVVKANPRELVAIARHIRNRSKHNLTIGPSYINKQGKIKYYIISTLYGDMTTGTRKHLLDTLSVTTCPYCNRSYINPAESKTGCHLDHFYDKMTYPILAVSFYNLIPVCSTCNTIKANRQLGYSPHNHSFTANDLFTFSYTPALVTGKPRIKLKLNSKSTIFQQNISALELDTLYQIHSDIVEEIIHKSTYYNSYRASLYKSLKITFSEEEIIRHFLGNYFTESTYDKRPLSKLTHDIAVETKIIK